MREANEWKTGWIKLKRTKEPHSQNSPNHVFTHALVAVAAPLVAPRSAKRNDD